MPADPLTFQQLLLLPMLQAQNQNQNGASQDHDHDDDDVNVIHNLLPLVPPDHFLSIKIISSHMTETLYQPIVLPD